MLDELSRYADTRAGPGSWTAIRQAAGLSSDFFLATNDYPDEDFMTLCRETARSTGQSLEELLEDFGTFLVPGLLAIYGTLVEPKWDVLAFLENTEEVIHRAVRLAHPGAKPPALKVLRTGDGEVTVIYGSARRLCALASGIIVGVAEHYKSSVRIHQDTCMQRGDPECRIRVAVA